MVTQNLYCATIVVNYSHVCMLNVVGAEDWMDEWSAKWRLDVYFSTLFCCLLCFSLLIYFSVFVSVVKSTSYFSVSIYLHHYNVSKINLALVNFISSSLYDVS